MINNKAQSSTEFLLVFGIGLSLTLILGAVFFSYFNEERHSLDKLQIQNIGDEVMSNVDKIYFLTRGNKFSIDANFPDGITNLSILHYYNMSNESFDILAIETYNNYTHYFESSETYIRFNCTKCHHNETIHMGQPVNISYYNESNFAQGMKKIKFESMGSWVSIDFVQ